MPVPAGLGPNEQTSAARYGAFRAEMAQIINDTSVTGQKKAAMMQAVNNCLPASKPVDFTNAELTSCLTDIVLQLPVIASG